MELKFPEGRVHLYYSPEASDDEPSYAFVKGARPGYFHWNESGEYINGRGDSPWFLYNLRELLSSNERVLYWAEGQRDADTLRKHGKLATDFQGLPLADTNLIEQIRIVAGPRINIIVPDNDEAGHQQAHRFANWLSSSIGSQEFIQRPLRYV